MNVDSGKYLLLKLLENQIIIEKDIVTVLMEFPPIQTLPAITMSRNGGTGVLETTIHKKLTPLKEDHPYYDPSHPDIPYAQENIYTDTSQQNLILHVWGTSNEERDHIVTEIQKTIYNSKKEGNPWFEKMAIHILDFQLGAPSDIDQYDLIPPLYHSTLNVKYFLDRYQIEKMNPFCAWEKS